MTILKKSTAPAFIFACMLGLAGCGGGGGGAGVEAPVPVTPAPTPAPEPTTPLSASPILLGSVDPLGKLFWPDGSTPAGGAGAPIGGVNCLVAEDYHIHAHVAIIQNGEMLAIPAQIGLQGCAYELHTHDRTGIIHIETSTSKKFTLGQFFAVWGQPLSRTNVAGITGLPVAVFVNDGATVTEIKGEIGDIEFAAHRSITIQLGTAVKEIPSYTWPAGT